MTTLPADAQARIERALAELELAVIWIQQHPIPWTTPDGDGDYLQIAPSPAERVQTEVLAALATIVDVVTAAGLSAVDRRQIVMMYRDQLLIQYALNSVTFDKALREQSWWERFQQTRRDAGVRSRSKKQATRADIPSFGQQLKQAMDEARVSVPRLVTALAEARTPLTRRTIERLRADDELPQIETIRILETALTKARNGVTFRFLLPTTSRQRRQSQPSRTRRKNAATRR